MYIDLFKKKNYKVVYSFIFSSSGTNVYDQRVAFVTLFRAKGQNLGYRSIIGHKEITNTKQSPQVRRTSKVSRMQKMH